VKCDPFGLPLIFYLINSLLFFFSGFIGRILDLESMSFLCRSVVVVVVVVLIRLSILKLLVKLLKVFRVLPCGRYS